MNEKTLAEKILADGLAPVWEEMLLEALPGTDMTVGSVIRDDTIKKPIAPEYNNGGFEAAALRAINAFVMHRAILHLYMDVAAKSAETKNHMDEAVFQLAHAKESSGQDMRGAIDGIILKWDDLWGEAIDEALGKIMEAGAGELALVRWITPDVHRNEERAFEARLAVAIEVLLLTIGSVEGKPTTTLANRYAARLMHAQYGTRGSGDTLDPTAPLRKARGRLSREEKGMIVMRMAQYVFWPLPYDPHYFIGTGNNPVLAVMKIVAPPE